MRVGVRVGARVMCEGVDEGVGVGEQRARDGEGKDEGAYTLPSISLTASPRTWTCVHVYVHTHAHARGHLRLRRTKLTLSLRQASRQQLLALRGTHSRHPCRRCRLGRPPLVTPTPIGGDQFGSRQSGGGPLQHPLPTAALLMLRRPPGTSSYVGQ